MSCESFERALALDVTGDLPEREAQALRAHLADCARCRAAGARLARSQAALRALADEELPVDALRSVRRRVRETIAAEPERGPRTVPAWAWTAAAAAALALVAGAIAWRARERGQVDLASTRREAPAAAGVGAELASARPDADAGTELASARTGEHEVAPRAPDRATHGRAAIAERDPDAVLEAALQRAEPLSAEDADQLARALIYVSQLDGLPPVPDEASESEDAATTPATVVRLATQDPNVVIYWQIDSNGG